MGRQFAVPLPQWPSRRQGRPTQTCRSGAVRSLGAAQLFGFFNQIHIHFQFPLNRMFFQTKVFKKSSVVLHGIDKIDETAPFFPLLFAPSNQCVATCTCTIPGRAAKATRFLWGSLMAFQREGSGGGRWSWQDFCSASSCSRQTSAAYLTVRWTLHSRVGKG